MLNTNKLLFSIIISLSFLGKAFSYPLDSLLHSLSPDELAGQMIMVYHSPPEFLEKHQLGNVLIMQNMLRDPRKLTKELERLSQWKIPAFTAIDQEGGKVNRLKYFKQFKKATPAKSMSSIDSKTLTRELKQISKRLKSLHINMNLAPVLDPTFNESGNETYMSLKQRSFGVELDSSHRSILLFVKTMKDQGVACITKHYPGYDAITNSDFEPAVSQASPSFIKKNAKVFAHYNSLTQGTMMSSIVFPKLDSTAAVFSPKLVAMARETNPNTLVITDDLWGVALRTALFKDYNAKTSSFTDDDFLKIVRTALTAGNDILMITFPQKAVLMKKYMASRIKKEPSFKKRVLESVKRILLSKKKMGLLI